ncbi:MAG TPA: hypothetical protein VH092_15640 [Urbifossiella sp.]|nr:hypothetical protein [Urbifossiella sp.]
MAHAECGSPAEVAQTHHCGESWVRRMTRLRRETGGLAPKSTARAGDRRAYDDKDEAAVREPIKERPDATPAEAAAAIGKPARAGAVRRALRRPGLVREKSPRARPGGTAPTSRRNGPPGSRGSRAGGPPT